MYDKLTRLYKRFLGGLTGIVIIVLFFAAIVAAFWLGLAYDFNNNSSEASVSFFIFPMVFITGSIWVYRQWKIHRRNQTTEALKDSLTDEETYFTRSR